MMKTIVLRCDVVQLTVSVLHLCSGPLSSGCKASQKIGMPGSPDLSCVAWTSDQCNVALAANLATAAGAMYLRLILRPVCVVNWMAECGVHLNLASTINSTPAGPTTFVQGFSVVDNLLSAPLRAV